MQYVKIPKSRLIELIESEIKLRLLENGGVDNWDWYGDSLEEFEEAFAKALKEIDTMEKL